MGPMVQPVGRGETAAALVLGLPVDDVTMDEVVDMIFGFVVDGRASGRSHQVATVNVDFVVNALGDPDVLTILQRTSLSIPDGMPVVWGARIMGTRLRTRVAGADLIDALVERAATVGARISFFGAAPGVAQRAADLLIERHAGAEIIADSGPHIPNVADLEVAELASLRDVQPDICCVALGNPKQERFIARFGDTFGIPVMIGVGGSLDFLVGTKTRAPRWMQRTGLEWMHRLLTEPRRLVGRYARDAVVFGPRMVRQAWTGRASKARGSVAFSTDADGNVMIDLSQLERAGNIVAAEIVGAARQARRAGTTVTVIGDRRGLQFVDGLAAFVSAAAGSP
jgi:N-acetylglucosaminyldiphosphoundecaprenol N-acetyl-beta-D-mannosaminyltransferase